MRKFEILIGTTLGGSEYVADEMAAQLQQAGHQVNTHLDPYLKDLDHSAIWLLVSSTHGAGDLPDNLQPFNLEIQSNKPDLSQVKYALCAIGDSCYDTFCLGPEKLISSFQQAGAIACVDKIQIDVQSNQIPEDVALTWLSSWMDQV